MTPEPLSRGLAVVALAGFGVGVASVAWTVRLGYALVL